MCLLWRSVRKEMFFGFFLMNTPVMFKYQSKGVKCYNNSKCKWQHSNRQVFLSQSRLGDGSLSDSSSFHPGTPQSSKSLESSQFSYKLGTKNGESLTGGGPRLEPPRICQQSIGQNSVPRPHLPARKAGDVIPLCFGENGKWFHNSQSVTQITHHFTTKSRFVLHFCDFQCQQIFF